LRASAEGQAALAKRGLSQGWCDVYELGWNDRERREWWGGTSVYLAAGIVIPWVDCGRLLKVNMRRLQGDPKYLQAAGGTNGLYNADWVPPEGVVVLVEGEFDAISLRAGADAFCHREDVIAVATGSTSGGRKLSSFARLIEARRVLLAFDADEAGDNAAAWWAARLPGKSARLRPTRHDVNAMLVAGDDIAAWLAQGLTRKD
jgi:5S rRNA maturation endonuclease (ribonuclease M5)